MKVQPFTNLPLDGKDFKVIRPFFRKLNQYSRTIDSIDTIVLHWTDANSNTDAVNTLTGTVKGYHFLIDKGGKIIQGAPLIRRVGHAGYSYGPQGAEVNTYSVGISFDVKPNDIGYTKDGDFTDEMYTTCANLIKDIKLSLPNIKFITGHQWVSPRRKVDPWSFDFNRLMTLLGSGYEIWKTGYPPFPEGLEQCSATAPYGKCIGPGGWGYSKDHLTTAVSDVSFSSDMDTE